MAPPKRALFSLNLDTDADRVYQRVEDHSEAGTDRVKVIETKGSTHGHTDLTYITKPFESTVNRAVNDVVDGTGKKVHSAQGELTYSTESSSSRTGSSNLNVKSKARRRALEEKYDTSEL
ncbi:hypothetical protein ACN47E_006905 [Coniothyrium glycines]